MSRLKLTILFSIFCLAAIAQQVKKAIQPPSASTYDILEKRMDCMFKHNYTSEKRKNFFPFNKTKKIVLISFEHQEPRDDYIITDTSRNAKELAQVVNQDQDEPPRSIIEMQHVYSQITKERRTLSPSGIDKLTNILYNFGYKSTKSYKGLQIAETGYNCYNPRNAILFLDDHDLLIAYIEICFECHQRRVSSEKIKLGEFCNQKYDMLRKFFNASDITFGTNTLNE
jgi:hypothetical protein